MTNLSLDPTCGEFEIAQHDVFDRSTNLECARIGVHTTYAGSQSRHCDRMNAVRDGLTRQMSAWKSSILDQ